MVNSQTIKEVVQGLKLDLNVDKIPPVIPVLEVNPKIVKNCKIISNNKTTSGDLNLVSAGGITQTNDVYVVGLKYSMIKDAACDVASGVIYINSRSDDANIYLAYIPVITLTAQDVDSFVFFPHPIKLDKNATVTFSGSFTAGVMIRAVTMFYFTDEVN